MQQFGDCTTACAWQAALSFEPFFQPFQKYFGGMSKSGCGFRSWAIRNSNR